MSTEFTKRRVALFFRKSTNFHEKDLGKTIKNRSCSNTLLPKSIPPFYNSSASNSCQFPTLPTLFLNVPKTSSQTLNGDSVPSRPYITPVNNPDVEKADLGQTISQYFKVPKVLVTNVRSLAPKMDEVSEFMLYHGIDLAFITETWLKKSIADDVINVPGYVVFRRDRNKDDHGGVCIYVNSRVCSFKQVNDISCCENHEIIWLYIRPKRLPRGFSCIIIGVLYYPPGGSDNSILEHLQHSFSLAESKYPNCGILLCGDFNRMNIKSLLRQFSLKQLIKVPTRNSAILDLMLTNMYDYYSPPQAFAPFGLSDHNTIVIEPKLKSQNTNEKMLVEKRDLRKRYKAELGRYLSSIDWVTTMSTKDNCEEMWNVFHELVLYGLDTFMPIRQVKQSTTDAPWINEHLKSLIKKRQKAFNTHGVMSSEFKYYRNLVNRERKLCRGKYYNANIHKLKEENPKMWWNAVKRLCNFKTKKHVFNQINVEDLSELSEKDQANKINEAFLSPLEEYKLEVPLSKLPLESPPIFPEVTEERVQCCLSKLNATKANGPDNIPNWLLKEYSFILALPLTYILCSSYREQQIPKSWKMADVVHLPKTKVVRDLKRDLRPISLTTCISKVAEEILVTDYIKPAILKVIDCNQYGTIPNSSTTIALISILHHWSIETDGNGSVARVIFFDYRKAFDFIDHSILISKISQLDIPRSVVNWMIDFLTNRFQRIKLAESCYSEWGAIPSGVPQGTKLGPWLFTLLINDLDVSHVDLWKYVDDSTTSEIIKKNSGTISQNVADEVINWSNQNRMQLNPDKCKELRISFNLDPVNFNPIIINGEEIKLVKSFKLLGLTINNTLTWNDHIDEVVKKVSKRLYFLTQLKRANVPCSDLVMFYKSCIRSVVDYAIPVFYKSLPQYLKNELVRLEKRALSIIMPNADYLGALETLEVKPIVEHHEHLCDKLFQSILQNPNHKLHHLLPPRHKSSYNLRREKLFDIPLTHTNRAKNSFILAMCNKFNCGF